MIPAKRPFIRVYCRRTKHATACKTLGWRCNCCSGIESGTRGLGCASYTDLSMSYTAAIEQLNAMVPELYTGTGQSRRKFSLDEVRTLLGALGDLERRLRCVLIAGTNGKGSTASTLSSILSASGLRTGLYTSPH